MEEEKYIKKEVRPCPNKCESCDRFDECYMIGIGMKNLCDDGSGRNLIFKLKEESV